MLAMTTHRSDVMDLPLVGVGLPFVGPHASPDAIVTVARAADRLGYHSVSVSDRLLVPAHEGWTNDFGLPEHASFDPLETLTWVAAATERIRLRTDVLVPLFQAPVVLARRLATLDHFSRGRLDLGLARGWLPQEFEATGVPAGDRAAAFEESVAALRACWEPDPVAFDGRHVRVPPALVGPKPHGGRRIAIQVGGVARPAIERAARIGDGLTVAFRNWEDTAEQVGWWRAAGGTGPLTVKAGPMLADAEHATPPVTWTPDHLLDSLARIATLGVHQLVWDLNIVGTPVDEQVALLTDLAPKLVR